MEAWENSPKGVRAGGMAPPLASCSTWGNRPCCTSPRQHSRDSLCWLQHLGELSLLLSWAELASWPQWYAPGRADRLTNSATTQTQIQDFELAYPNMYPMYKLLELLRGLALQNQSYTISKTQSNNKVSGRILTEDPVLNRTEARGLRPYRLLRAMNSCKKKLFGHTV